MRVPDGLQVPEHDEASAWGVGAGRVCRGRGGSGKQGILEARGDEAGPRLLRTRRGGLGRWAGRSGAAAKHLVEGCVGGPARELLLEGLRDLCHPRLGFYAPERLHQGLAERVLCRDH